MEKMKRNLKLLLLLTLYPGWLFAQTITTTLSPAAQISLLTLSPGEELYSTFGHSAIRITDPLNGLDKVYNYGTFDFGEPGFYVKFVRGKLNYRLSTAPFTHMYWEAQQQNRSLIEQVLVLSAAQKQQLFTFVEWNALPENRDYRYDFFYDNCSTRIRDVLKRICGNSLEFNLKLDKTYTFRQLLDIYLDDKYWADFGMDIGQGTPSDRIATPYQSMFLPDFLMEGFDSATLLQNGKPIRLVDQTKTLFEATPVPVQSTIFRPVLITSLLLGLTLIVTFFDFKRKRKTGWLDIVLFGSTTTLGLLLLFLWVGTDHSVTKNNWNLLWAFPGHCLLLGISRKKVIAAGYWLTFSIVLAVLLVCLPWLPQEIDGELIPLILALGIRALFLYYYTRSSVKQPKRRIQV